MTAYALLGLPLYNVKVAPYGAAGNGTTDDSAAIQAAITACKAAGGGAVFFPRGTYKCLSTLTLPVGGTTPVSLLGDGEASVLSFPNDLGSGNYAIDQTVGGSNSASPIRIEGLRVQGQSRPADLGTTPANMHGIRLRNGGRIEKCSVQGFRGGVVMDGDHNRVVDCELTNNFYGLYWGPNHTSASDQTILDCGLDGNLWAGVGIAKDNTIDGVGFYGCHFGYGAYGLWKETTTSGAGALIPWTSTDALFVECAFEGCNNGISAAEATGIGFDATFVKCNQGSMFGTGIVGQPQDYCFDHGNGTLRLRFHGANPLTIGALGVFNGNISLLVIDEMAVSFDACRTAAKAYIAGSVQYFRGYYNGNRVRAGTTGTAVTRGDVLEGTSNDGVAPCGYESVARPIKGVALADAANPGICFYQVEGRVLTRAAAALGYRVWVKGSSAAASKGQAQLYTAGTDDASRICGASDDNDYSGGLTTIKLARV